MKSWLAVTSIKFFALLPLWLLRIVGSWVGYVVWLSNDRSRKITEFNIKLCFPGWTDAERESLVKQSMRQFGVLLFETGPVWRWSPAKLLQHIKAVHNLELLEQAQAGGCGTIVVLPHLGCWEIMGSFLGARGKVTSLYQPPDDPALDKMIFEARERTGNTLVPTNTRGVKALLKALKAGETVVILPDQLPEIGSGEFADFYQQPTYTMTLLYNLVKRTGANVVGAAALRVASSAYEIHFIEAPEEIGNDDLVSALTAVNQLVEACVERSPAQYQWEYNRFKLLPGGEVRSYRDVS